MNIRSIVARSLLTLTLVAAPLAPAMADPLYWPFGDHSRVNEVNRRLDNVEFRLRRDMDMRAFGIYDAERLQDRERAIRREEERMRNAHLGYINADEQSELNRRIDELERDMQSCERH